MDNRTDQHFMNRSGGGMGLVVIVVQMVMAVVMMAVSMAGLD